MKISTDKPLYNDAVLMEAVQWDVINWYRAVQFWQKESRQEWAGAKVLEIGARDGGLSLWFAAQGAHVVSTDINGPSDVAQERFACSNFAGSIECANVDATNIPYEDNSFDLVVFKSVVGGIGANGGVPAQQKAVREMWRVLRRRGELLFAENLKASVAHRVARKLFVKWGQRWLYITKHDMEKFCEMFASTKLKTLGFSAAFGQNEIQRQILGYLDAALLDSIVLENCRYIVCGVATK